MATETTEIKNPADNGGLIEPVVSVPVSHATVYEELKCGGNWLGAARQWMQTNIKGGDVMLWNSTELVQIPFYKLEELAQKVAVAAVAADRNKRAH